MDKCIVGVGTGDTRAYWLVSLAKTASSRFGKRPCLSLKWRVIKKTPEDNF